LPELDIEAVFFITDSPESFPYFTRLTHSKGLRYFDKCFCPVNLILTNLFVSRILHHLRARGKDHRA
jgi:hypothetical protein